MKLNATIFNNFILRKGDKWYRLKEYVVKAQYLDVFVYKQTIEVYTKDQEHLPDYEVSCIKNVITETSIFVSKLRNSKQSSSTLTGIKLMRSITLMWLEN